MLAHEIDENDVIEVRKNLDNIESPLTATQRKQQVRSELDQKARDMLTNKLTARPFFKRCEFRHLEMMQQYIQIALEERRQEEQERLERLAAKQEMLHKIAELMNSEEIDLEDLATFTTQNKKRTIRKKIAADGSEVKETSPNIIKYKCHIFDKDYWWNGKGMMPKTFQCHLAKGHTVESIQLDASEFFILNSRSYQKIDSQYKSQVQTLLANFQKLKLSKYVKHPQKVTNHESLPVKDSV